MKVSASSLERALRCPGSLVLPQANTSSVWAQQGTAGHDEQEAAVAAGELPDVVRNILGPAAATVRAEVMLAYDTSTDTGRIVGQGSGRSYGDLAPTEIPGTADLLAHDDRRVYVIDKKLWQDVTPATRNVQLAHLALTAARALGKDEAVVAITYEIGTHDKAELDAVDLDTHAARLRTLDGRIAEQAARVSAGVMPDVAEGTWCKHCPSTPSCPAKVALIRRLVSGQESDDLAMLVPLDDATAALAYERLGHAKNLLKRIEAAIYARAAESPIPLGDGRFFGKHIKVGNEQLDGDRLYEVVRDRYGRDVADAAVARAATKKRLKDVIKTLPLSPGETLTGVERDLLAELRKRGGAKRERTEAVGEYEADNDNSIKSLKEQHQ